MSPRRHRPLVTAGALCAMFMAAIEATAVTAAMPSAIAELGGLARYSWVFSAYLLTSTTTMPLYGRLADLYGRRPVYLWAVGLFLVGSVGSGLAQSLGQLIAARSVQGLGAGGVTPVAATVIADLYSVEERSRLQGILASVWAVTSLVGPFIGGVVTDLTSWRWVFFLGVPAGLLSAGLLQRYLPARPRPHRRHRLDIPGTVLLTTSVAVLLLALTEGVQRWGLRGAPTLGLLGLAGLGLAAFVAVERRSPEPILPPDLFARPLIAVASIGNTLIGALLFALTTFVPLHAQVTHGGNATAAASAITPVLLGWPLATVVVARALLRLGYRPLAICGGLLTTTGILALAFASHSLHRGMLFACMFTTGVGFAFLSMPYLLGVQNAVAEEQRGVATSSVQFFRSLGGALAVAGLGALFNARLARAGDGGLPLDLTRVLLAGERGGLAPEELAAAAGALGGALQAVLWATVALAALGSLNAFALPRGSVDALAHHESGDPDLPPSSLYGGH
jgi:EmrB/QacA subfamily drug resistance transporter